MDNKLNGTRTEQCLINSFAGESQARNRYTFFASIAKNEGFEQIAGIFLETADNEREHAYQFYRHLGHGRGRINAEYPFMLGNTYENLKSAAMGEHEEWTDLYLNGSLIAAEEGFMDVSNTFKNVLEVEKHHEARYQALIKNLEENEVFKKTSEVYWKCRNCGRTIQGSEAPEICPTCFYHRAYFELLCDNF